jgi:hypothetical protein
MMTVWEILYRRSYKPNKAPIKTPAQAARNEYNGAEAAKCMNPPKIALKWD